MATLIVLFNLKDGQSTEDYEKWAQNIDVPTVKRLKSVDDFRVYRAQGLLGSDSPSPYKYIEIIEVNDPAGLGEEIGTETVQKVAGEFQSMADNPIFIMTDQFA